MNTAYCFVEKQDKELEDFISKYDDTFVIHIISSISESCENNLFYCLGEITNVFIQEEKKCWFVTDVLQLYDIVLNMYHSYFDNVLYIEQGTPQVFGNKVNYKELLNYEKEQCLDNEGKKLLTHIVDFNEHPDIVGMFDISIRLHDIFESCEWKEKGFWIHAFEMVLFYMKGKKTTDIY